MVVCLDVLTLRWTGSLSSEYPTFCLVTAGIETPPELGKRKIDGWISW